MNTRFLLLSIVATAPFAVAQTAAAVNYGAGCNGLTLNANGLPVLGTTIGLDVSGPLALAPIDFVALGTQVVNPGIPLVSIGAIGCSAFTNADLGLFATGLVSGTTGTFLLNIPAAPGLGGTVLSAEGLRLGFNNPLGLDFSNGTQLTLGPAGGPIITGVSNPNPVAGQMVTFFGAGFPADGRMVCLPGFLGMATNAAGTQLTAMALNNPGTHTIEIANFEPGTATLFGPGGTPWVLPPGVTLPQTTVGLVGRIDPTTGTQTQMQVTIQPAPGSVAATVTIDGLGRICVDFGAINWVGGEHVMIELHWDNSPTPPDGRHHCDFVCNAFTVPNPPAGNCAQIAAFFTSANILAQCPGVSFTWVGNVFYIVPPLNGTFYNLHPLSKVVVS